jgi:hypothetical protein
MIDIPINCAGNIACKPTIANPAMERKFAIICNINSYSKKYNNSIQFVYLRA